MRRSAASGLALLGLAALAASTFLHQGANAQTQSKPPVFADFKSKLALDGYDAVAYFKTGKPERGNPAHKASWNGATWHFASAENKAAFEANPQAFAPQYGGYCAWAVSEGYTAKGDPHAWRIVDGKLYVNYNASVQKNWEKNIPGHIAKGEKNWPNVLAK
ncbi:MAG: YHS domain-containing (seleno)protein [Hyphomicrobiaceae bacterium]